jgi:hypothetical protein
MKYVLLDATCHRYTITIHHPGYIEANLSTYYKAIVINFTEKYACIVQGTLIRPDPNSNDVDFRISVSERLLYVDEKTNKIIPDVWKRVLSWTFCRAAKAKRGDDNAGHQTTSAVPEENDNLCPRSGNESWMIRRRRLFALRASRPLGMIRRKRLCALRASRLLQRHERRIRSLSEMANPSVEAKE